MKGNTSAKHCKECDKIIRPHNKSNLCFICNGNRLQKKYRDEKAFRRNK